MSTSLWFLDRHWVELTQAPTTVDALARWATETPLLAVRSCEELLSKTRAAPPAEADAILAQLASRAPTDQTAAAVLLHALRPGLGRLATQLRSDERQTIGEDLTAIAWERIRTYPYERRPGRIAANVLLDTRHRYLATQQPDHRLTHLDRDLEEPPMERHYEPPTQQQAAERLRWAINNRVLSPATGNIIHRIHIEQHAMESVAESFEVSTDTLARRRRRALAALRAAPVRPPRRTSPASRDRSVAL